MADSFDNEAEAEPTITIKDYLKAVEEEELEVDLVLGGDEGKECTYAKGYMKRQAVFSCLTCTPEGNAGVCTACCLSCHDGHEMVELWTKRNFRCDCGNSKFGEFYCKLLASKDVDNSENAYNHNFKGTYCTCDLPYPDPNADDQVEMIQCCICEDWFHEEHIGLQSSDEVPRDEEGEPLYEDFICQGCAVDCSFLTHYAQTVLVSNLVVKESAAGASPEKTENDNMPIDADADSLLAKCTEVVDPNPMEDKAVEVQSPAGTSLKKIETGNSSLSTFVEVSDVTDKMPVDASTESSVCKLGIDLIRNQPTLDNINPMFLSKNWRDVLCRCKICSDFYGQKGVGYLLDKDDTIAEYERQAKLKRNENMQKQEGAEQDFLNKLGHIERIELLSGIADMKKEFSDFLESSDPSKAITPADIQQVFENLNKKRKRMP